ncbi:MAG: ATP synthase F1 subunit epsilon [bacterium]|nr:ATP synthase F1 subunit epsilon [bacterium]
MALRLRIVTIEKVLVDQEVELVTVPTQQGATSILPGHVSLLARVMPGLVRYKTARHEARLVCSTGSIEVKANAVTLLVGEAVPVESIDRDKAEAERTRLIGDIKSGQLTAIELKEAREQLATAVAKLRS